MLVRCDLNGSPFLGVYVCASNEHAVVGPGATPTFHETIAEALEVPVIETTIGGAGVIGALMAMNSNGAIVGDLVVPREREVLEEEGLRVEVLPPPLNAAGNVVLANDHGCIVHPAMSSKARERVELALGVPATPTTIAGLRTPGAVAVATNRGVLVHPKATDDEVDTVAEALGVEVMHCTVNHGSPYLGAGLAVNTLGALIGNTTTGPEMARIEDGLGYLE